MSSHKKDLPREYDVTIERLSHEGRGVAHFQGKTVFVADALPGEQVHAKVMRRHRRYDEARAERIENPHADRVIPVCAHAALCGGCSLQHLSSAAQLAHKQGVLLELLKHQANTAPREIIPTVTGELWGYRRRARLSVRVVPKKGGAIVGFREKASHFVTAIDHCAVLVPSIGARLPELRALLDKLSIVSLIPQIEVAADDDVAVLVIRHQAPPTADDHALLREFAERTGLRICLQAGDRGTLLPLSGPLTLHYRLGELVFEFLPGDFVQVNAGLNSALVECALACLKPTLHDDVADLFSGLGNFTLPLATHAHEVIGFEGDAGLVERARANAEANGLPNVAFVTADLYDSRGVTQLATRSFAKVLLDPPRSGAELALRTLDLAATRRIVYVSCNPVTLARDTAILVRDRGFVLRAAGIIDMFPHTSHVESIAVFEPAR